MPSCNIHCLALDRYDGKLPEILSLDFSLWISPFPRPARSWNANNNVEDMPFRAVNAGLNKDLGTGAQLIEIDIR